jgi:hypothetical protein
VAAKFFKAKSKMMLWRPWLHPWSQPVPAGWCVAPRGVHRAMAAVRVPRIRIHPHFWNLDSPVSVVPLHWWPRPDRWSQTTEQKCAYLYSAKLSNRGADDYFHNNFEAGSGSIIILGSVSDPLQRIISDQGGSGSTKLPIMSLFSRDRIHRGRLK